MDHMVSFDLTGKAALVTDASYGIDFAIASAITAAGATILAYIDRQPDEE